MSLLNEIKGTLEKEGISTKEYIDYYKTGNNLFDWKNAQYDSTIDGYNNGIAAGSLNMIIGKSGSGKAQPLHANILTPTGYKKMGDIQVGDQVLTPSGKSSTVTGVFPQGKKENFKVTFTDDTSMECNDEHLFEVYNLAWSRKRKETYESSHVMSLHEIMKDYKNKDGKLKYYIPMTEPVEFKAMEELPIDPYVLGAMIGDGSFSVKAQNIRFSNSEQDIIDKVSTIMNEDHGTSFSKVSKDHNDYHISNISDFKAKLNEVGLYGKKSKDKFIPEIYKFASIEDRTQLLTGLFDTDGCIENGSSLVFYTTAEQLVRDVKFLVQSLGGTMTYRTKETFYRSNTDEKIFTNDTYVCTIKMPLGNLPFSSEKHKSRHSEPIHYKNPYRKIKNIEFLEEEVDMQCIMIDSDEHLYLTEEFITTHNTTWAIQAATNIAEKYKNSNIIHFDFEHSTTIQRVMSLSGWNEETFNDKYLFLNSGITAEAFYRTVKSISTIKAEKKDELMYETGRTDLEGNSIKEYEPTIIILDSIATMSSDQNSQEEELSGQMSATAQARINNQIAKRLVGSSALSDYNIIILAINHITTKIEINPFAKTPADINYLKQDESLVGKQYCSL